MASPALVLAAQTNGRKSRGPKTTAGKRKSASNSRKHGLSSQNAPYDEQCHRDHLRFRAMYTAEFLPANPFEESLVETIALADARKRWVWRSQTAFLNAQLEISPDPSANLHSRLFHILDTASSREYDLLHILENRLFRQARDARRALEEARKPFPETPKTAKRTKSRENQGPQSGHHFVETNRIPQIPHRQPFHPTRTTLGQSPIRPKRKNPGTNRIALRSTLGTSSHQRRTPSGQPWHPSRMARGHALPALISSNFGVFPTLNRLSLAFRAFFALLFSGKLPDDLIAQLGLIVKPAPVPPPPPKPEIKPEDGALQLLGMLQRDARILDFFMEDIGPYTDDQVGAAARDVHTHTRELLVRCFAPAPVIDAVEGSVASPPPGSDQANAALVKYIGNVPAKGKPPAGLLRHKGWRATAANLPKLNSRQDLVVLAPAEIEVE